MMSDPALAIDFGTSRTKVAWRDADGIVHLLHFDGLPYLPSIFYLPKGTHNTLIGQDAVNALDKDPLGLVTELKRKIERGDQKIRHSEDRITDTLELLTHLFKAIKRVALEDVNIFNGILPEQICLTIPGNANENLEFQLKQAAKAVGWVMVQTVPEPVAAARSWLYSKEHRDKEDAMVVVLDCGGGTTDWACLQRTGTRIHRAEQFVPGAISVGGVDVDRALCTWIWEKYPDLFDPYDEPRLRYRLKEWKEAMLNGDNSAPICIKGKLLDLNKPILTRIYKEALLDKVLPSFEHFLQPIVAKNPDVPVLLVGGSATRLLERAVSEYNLPVFLSQDRNSAVAKGALEIDIKHKQAFTKAIEVIPNIYGSSVERVKALQKATADSLNLPVAFRYKLKNGEYGPDMQVIPAGSIMVSSPDSEPERLTKEGPLRPVTFQPFAIGCFAVTFEEYDLYCQSVNIKKADDEGWGRGKRPVINVSWYDAQAYCAWLSEQTEQHYRLPSEVEWEYACRAGTVTPFHFGNRINSEQANFDGNYTYNGSVKGEHRKQTIPVNYFVPNPWGIYQMHGNVWEWCEDCWHLCNENAPNNGEAWTNSDPIFRIIRGGSWQSVPADLRSANRVGCKVNQRRNDLGFRIIQEIIK